MPPAIAADNAVFAAPSRGAGSAHVLDDADELARFTRWEQRGAERQAVSQLRLSGLLCAAGAGII
jgi:hypothetical protein